MTRKIWIATASSVVALSVMATSASADSAAPAPGASQSSVDPSASGEDASPEASVDEAVPDVEPSSEVPVDEAAPDAEGSPEALVDSSDPGVESSPEALGMEHVMARGARERALLEKAVKNFSERGKEYVESDLSIEEIETTDGPATYVVSNSIQLELVADGRRTQDGRPIHQVRATIRPEMSLRDSSSADMPEAAGGSRWVPAGDGCYDVDFEYWGRTVCTAFSYLQGDNSRRYDWYQFRTDAAGQTKGGNWFKGYPYMTRMWVESFRTPNSPAQKLTTLPKPSAEMNAATGCWTANLSVTSGGPPTVGLGYSKTICDKWVPKRYGDSTTQAHWANVWSGSAKHTMRDVALNVPFRVKQNSRPNRSWYDGQSVAWR